MNAAEAQKVKNLLLQHDDQFRLLVEQHHQLDHRLHERLELHSQPGAALLLVLLPFSERLLTRCNPSLANRSTLFRIAGTRNEPAMLVTLAAASASLMPTAVT